MEFAYHFRTWQMSDNNTEWLGKYGDWLLFPKYFFFVIFSLKTVYEGEYKIAHLFSITWTVFENNNDNKSFVSSYCLFMIKIV